MSEQRRDFVVFSDDWGRHPSSCQHLFARISERDRVLWVNTIGMRSPRADRFTFLRGFEKLREWSRPLRRVNENLWVLAPPMLPCAGRGVVGRLNARLVVAAIRRAMRTINMTAPTVWATVPTAADYLGKLSERAVVYNVTDDYQLWPGANGETIRDQDRRLTEAADLILACGEALAESRTNDRARTLLFPHGVDTGHFQKPRPEPADLVGIPHPRLCFFGLIYEKIDTAALAALARARPDVHQVLIGPVKTDVSALRALPNVHLLGARPYDELPAYLQAADAFVLPYVVDESTRGNAPLKLRECLAVGRPIVARAIPDLSPMADMVSLYDDPADLPAALDRALASDADLGERMRRRVAGDSWAARVATMHRHLDALDAGRLRKARRPVGVTDAPPRDHADYIAAHPGARFAHDPRWGGVLAEAYGSRPVYLTARRDGRVVGVLQLVGQRSVLFGSHLSAVPYFDIGGLLADDADTRADLLAEARRVMARGRWGFVELRHDAHDPDDGLPARTDKITMRLDLPPDAETLWSALKPKVRNQVRKAQREGLTVERGGAELVDAFAGVYERNMRDLGSPPHARRFFHRIVATFADGVELFVVRRGDRVVAASLTFADRAGVTVPWAASDWRERSSCANMLLYWEMLRAACERGAGMFDFGRSTRGSGTHRFKAQWGAGEVGLRWSYLLPAGMALPAPKQDSGKYRAAAACWRKMPVGMSRALGPHIVGGLS